MSQNTEAAVAVETTVPAAETTPTRRRRGPNKPKVAAEAGRTNSNKRKLTAKGNNQTVTKSAAELLADQEVALIKQYKQIIPGSIKRHNSGHYAGKITVEIRCKTKDCPNTRVVATSDLFQVEYCVECTEARRQARRKKNKKAAAKA